MPTLRSCGVLIIRARPVREFLLMKHSDRWDLPKGHVDPGETDLECALREMREETGIPDDAVRIDPQFLFEHVYTVQTRRVPGGKAVKTLRIYLAELLQDVPIVLTEHLDFAWIPWNPPHRIQEKTIDPLLQSVEEYWRRPPGE